MDPAAATVEQVFRCTRCGERCRIPGQTHLTDGDIPRLASFLGETEWDFIAANK